MAETTVKQTDLIERPIASPWQRLLAYLIDVAIWILVFEGLLWWITSARTTEQLLGSLLGTIILLIFSITICQMFYVTLMTGWFGGTLGKIFSGLKIVNSQGQLLSFWRAFFRNVLGYWVSGMLFGLGFVWIFIDEKRRAWHDMMADSLVVTRHRLGYLTGAVALLTILIVNLFLGKVIWRQLTNNLPFYQNIFEDIVEELTPSVTNNESNH